MCGAWHGRCDAEAKFDMFCVMLPHTDCVWYRAVSVWRQIAFQLVVDENSCLLEAIHSFFDPTINISIFMYLFFVDCSFLRILQRSISCGFICILLVAVV